MYHYNDDYIFFKYWTIWTLILSYIEIFGNHLTDIIRKLEAARKYAHRVD